MKRCRSTSQFRFRSGTIKMWRFAVVYLRLNALVLIIAPQSHGYNNSKRSWKAEGENDVIPYKRTFGSSEPPCNTSHGVYLERWDRIDYKRVRYLLMDARYPNLPTLSMCIPTFEQPSNWTDFFGSRLRTYFVPLQTGNHYFFLSSNAGSELFISTNESPKEKTEISSISGGFPTSQYEYDRFANQKSLPVYLKKGHYYYMEAYFKDDHQNDHLEVGLQTPDETFYKVIPSQFLWTTPRLSASQNATYQAILMKVAARAGANAGLSFGARWAMKSGANAGAKAGSLAGMEAGASAGAAAGEKAAIEMTTKTLEDALNSLHGDNVHKYNIIVKNGSVIAVTGPGMYGASGTGATSSAAATAAAGAAAVGEAGAVSGTGGAGGTAGTAGTAGGGGGGGGGVGSAGGVSVGTGTATGVGTGVGVGGGAAAGGAGGGVEGGTGVGGGGGGGGVIGAAVGGMAGGGGGGGGMVGGGGGGGGGATIGTGVGAPTVVGGKERITYLLKPGENPQVLAKQLVYRGGTASKIVQNGMYTIHSMDLPFMQENGSLNFCWQSRDGWMAIRPFCQVFITRMPALYQKMKKGKESVSFESVCLPGFFVRQKNYHYILDKRDGSELFDKESSFKIYNVMRFDRTFLLKSMHKDWFICQNKENDGHGNTELVLDFYNGDPDVLERCTFSFYPISLSDNKHKHCKNVAGPVNHPSISGQPLPHPAHLVPETPLPGPAQPTCIPVCPAAAVGGTQGEQTITPAFPGEPSGASSEKTCVALNFINNVGSPFKLFSSVKHEGYLVAGSGFRLKLMIDRPELHSYVTFNAEDPDRKRKILLNGKTNISLPAVTSCDEFVDVSVAAEKGLAPLNPPQVPPVTFSPPSLRPPSPLPLPFSPPPPRPPPPPQFAVPSPPAPQAPPAPPAPPPPSLPSPPPSGASPPALSPPAAYPVPQPQIPPVAQSPSAPQSPPAPSPSVQGTPSSQSDNESVHYHYHYHNSKTPVHVHACPSSCTDSLQCLPTCPLRCCKRGLNGYVENTTMKRDCVCAKKCRNLESRLKTRRKRCYLFCSYLCRHVVH